MKIQGKHTESYFCNHRTHEAFFSKIGNLKPTKKDNSIWQQIFKTLCCGAKYTIKFSFGGSKDGSVEEVFSGPESRLPVPM